jgi:hypothetical protein
MSEIAAPPAFAGPAEPAADSWQAPDGRRRLQLALATIWLLDAVLQCQPAMFSKTFGEMIGAAAPGNPRVVAGPITWNARLIEHHAVLLNTIFATIQLLIAIGIAYRPAVRVALAGSVLWSLGVWWLGEGLGGIFSGLASPLEGAPGPVLIYAVIAVLLWPADRESSAPFLAGRAVGTGAARAIWAVFWAALACISLRALSLTATGPRDLMGDFPQHADPDWLARLQKAAACAVGHHGIALPIGLAVVFTVIAAGVSLPAPAFRVVIVATIVLAALIWVIGEGLGGVLTGRGTDPGSGPLLALLALAYWPLAGKPSARRD